MMKWLSIVPLAACLDVGRTSDDGYWTRTPAECRPLADRTRLIENLPSGDELVPHGDTVLVGTIDGIFEASLDGGSRLVASGYISGQLGVIDGNLAYFDIKAAEQRAVVLDRGGDAGVRYERLSDLTAREVDDLIVIPAGVYWHEGPAKGRRWSEDITTAFDLDTTSKVVTDGDYFGFRTSEDLAVKPVTGGPAQYITRGNGDTPAAMVNGELLYMRSTGGTQASLVAHAVAQGTERLVTDSIPVANGAVACSTHFYWRDTNSIFRIPLAGGEPEVVLGGSGGVIGALAADDCNVYWTLYAADSVSLNARPH
jgi:hypothetical protein